MEKRVHNEFMSGIDIFRAPFFSGSTLWAMQWVVDFALRIHRETKDEDIGIAKKYASGGWHLAPHFMTVDMISAAIEKSKPE